MYKRAIRILLLVLITALLPLSAHAAFNARVDGFDSYSSALSGVGVRAVAIQPWDGKILIGGDFSISHGDPPVARQHLARLNSDGSVDTGFTPSPDGPVNSIVIQTNGADPSQSMILIGGSFTEVTSGGPTRKGLARLASGDGSLDPLFNPVSTTDNVTINAIALRPDGLSIVVGGKFPKLKPDHPTPNLAGIVVAGADPLGSQNWSPSGGIIADAANEVNAILLQGGQVVVGGRFDSSGASDIARFNADGSFDDQFNPPSPGGPVRALALQSDGKIVLAGSFPAGGPVRRLNGDGTLDGTLNQVFDAGGSVSSLVVQPDGRILVAGAFTSSVEPELRRNLARLKIDGTLEAAVFRNLDGPVNVVLRQPDGGILAGGEFTTAGEDETGAGRPRTMLARFYPHGALDDDIPVEELALDYAVQAISLHPEGVTIAGLFENVQGLERIHIARLKENWFLDTSFNETLMILASVYVLAPMPEGALLVGGNFPWPYNTSVLIDAGGDPYGPQTLAYNETLSAQLDVMGESTAIALLPPDTPLPGGGYSDEGMMYLAARFLDDVSFQSSFLSRIKSDGLRDDTFQPAGVDERADALALQSDGKLLVGTESGKLMRLLITGAPDPAWNGGVPLQLGDMITSIVQQKDGRLLVAGYFADVNAGVNQDTGDPVTWNRNILRLNSDGTRDNSFNVETSFVSSSTYTSNVMGSVLQADGKILIYGVFDRVLDGRGVLHVRDNVARLTANGELDSEFDLGSFAYDGGPIGNVSAVNLQQDGKLVLGGHFVGVNSSPRHRLARFANGWAREELSVAANGSSITWLREGTGPEVSRVTFEFCADPDDPAAQWTFLGNGHRIEGGWRLDGLDLTQPQYGLEANRYVRARGYAAGEKGGAGSLVESVRLYYLQEVTQSVLTVTAHAQSKTYGDPDPVLTYSASGFVNGDTSAIMTGSLERVAGSNVGSYAIGQGTLSAGPNYTIVFTGATLSINPAPLAVAAVAQSKSYGVAADPALTYSASGFVNGDSSAIMSGGLARAGGENAGSYAIGQGTLSAGANYSIAFTGAEFVINPAALAVTANAQSKVYGTVPDPGLTYGASGFVNGDSVAIMSGGLVRAAGESVGSYAIGQGTLGAGANYTIAFTGADLSITPASLTVAATAQTKTYGAADPAPLGYTVSGYVNGDTVAIFTGSLNRAGGEEVGSYAIGQGTLSAGANYAITFTGADLTITPASLTVAATAQSKSYGAADPASLGYTASGYVNGETAAILTGSLTRAAGENVGSYAISQGTLSAGYNYTITFTGSTLTITPAPLTITAIAQTKTYGASDPSPLSLTVSGYVNGDTAAILTGSLTRAAGENAGSYAINQGTLSAGANYTIAFTGSMLTITPASLTIAATAQSKTYGASDPSPFGYTVSGYVNGDTAAILTGSLTRAAGENVGSYAIGQGTLSAGANYTIAFTGSTLTITPASLTITATAQAKIYGASDPSPLGYTASGYVNGDTAAILTGSLTRAAGESVGSYVINHGTLSAGGNYTIAFTGADLTITPAQLTIGAAAQSKTYGAPDPSPLGYTVTGYVNGDTATILTGTLTRAAGETAGNYAISQGTVSAGPNYSIAFTGSTLTITPAVLTITATPQTKTYGAPDPSPLSYSVSGYVNGDTSAILTGTLTRAAGETAGNYAISQGTVSAGPNYTIAFTGSSLTITPAVLTITATPQTKTYGAPYPSPLSYSVSGYVNGDTAAILTGSLTRAAGENVGSYAISQGTLSAGANYTIAFTGSTLTITPAPLTIAATAHSKIYGAPDPSPLGYTASGYVNGDTAAILTGSLTRAAGENVGSYDISQGTLSAGANYTIAFIGSTLTINPAPLTIAATAHSKSYGASDPSPLGYTVSGYVNGDTAAILTGSLTRAPGETVGSYAIGQGTLSAGANYTIAFTGASLTIAQASLAVTATAHNKAYGSADPYPLGYNVTGFLNGDSAAILTGSLARAPGENVGSYPIGQGTLSAGPNYSITFVGANLTITAASLTVTATPHGKIYGAADPNPFGYTSSGYVNGDTAAILTGSLTRAVGENAGSYAIGQGTLSAGANYSIAFTGAALTITSAPLTISAENKERPRGAPNPELTATYQGLASFDTIASLGGLPSLTTSADESSAVGNYPIIAALGSITSSNYTYSFVPGILTVTAGAQQTITFNPLRPKTFGDGDFDPGATASSGLPVTYANSAPAIASIVGGKIRVLAPGSTEITASQAGNQQYEPAAEVTRTLMVNPPPWNGLGFDGSDDQLQILDAPQLNFGNKTGFSIETWLRLDGSQPDGVGLVSKGEGGSPWSGYQLILHQNRIAAEIGYGAATLGVPDGLIGTSALNDGQWHHVALTVDRVQATAALYLDGRLEAQVPNPTLGLDPDSAGNLQVGVDRTETRFFKGRIDELRLWDSARSREEIRNVVSQIIDPQDEPHLVAYYHFDEGDVGLDNAAFTTAPERTAHGAHATLQGFALTGADSNWIRSGAFIPLLETAPISSISSNAATGGGMVYPNYYPATDVGLCWGTTPNPGLGDTCGHSGSGSGAYVTALTGLTPGVTYHVRAFATNQMGTAYGNDLTFQTARLPQDIDFAPLADRTYGDAAVTLSGSASSGLPVGYTSSNPAVAVVANGEIRIRGAGTTVITASQPGNETYSPANDVPQSLTVLKKALSVTADNKSRVYLSANPTLTASYAGFVPGEDASVISGAPELSTTATPASPVGEYPIMVALGTLAAANYSIVLSNAILTVRPAAQSISFGPIADRTYGDAAFQAGGSATSGLPISYTSSNPAAAVVVDGEIRITGAGSTVITASQAGNESFEPAPDVPQSFTVRKKALTLTAEDKSRVYLSANPTLTASYQGFVLGEDSTAISGTPDLSTTATAASPVGEYPIMAGLGTLAAQNYSFVLVNGTLTVRPASQSIAFNPLRPKTFGDGDFDPGATASSGLPVTYASSAPAIASIVGGKIRVLAPGSTEITASQAGNQQYEPAAEVTRTLMVNPPPWNGLGFDGSDDRLQILDAPQLNFGNKTGFSIETWLRLDGSQPDGTGLVSKGEGGSPWSGYQLILHQNRIAAEIGYGAATLGVPDGLIGTSTLNDGQWHHVALTVDRVQATAALYLDGRLEAQVPNPTLGLDPDSAGNLQVGVDRTETHFLKGRIDELRLWDSARSREEIRNVVSQIIDPQDEPHLVAYYHFDEGDVGLDNAAFTTAPERTAHGAHATLQGFALSGADSNWIRSGAFIPLLETALISSISSNAATGGGTVYPNYYPATDVGLCWGTAPNPGLGDTCSRSGSGSGPFVAAITGLTPGITYHVRAFATNLMGTAYGNNITFQTARLDQAINFAPLANRTYGDAAVTLNGSASSGLPLTYTSSKPAVAVVVNGEIRIRGAGNTVITASQPGNETYSPAADVHCSFTVLKKALSVTADDKSRAYRTPNPNLTASYQGFIAGEDRAVISGTPSLSTTAGLESAVGNYDIVTGIGSLAAENYQFVLVNGTLTVFQSCQEIIFPPVSDKTYGDPPFALSASACSGLTLSFTSSNPQVAQVNGKVLTVTGAGSTVITARQQGTGDLEPPPEVSRTLVVHKSGQVLSIAPLGQKVLGDAPFALNATASSALPVSYQSSDPGVASVSGSEVTIVGAGTTVITAWQEGNSNYNAALPASQPLTVVLEGIAPLLTLSTLPSGAVTADPVLNVMGSASDASGIAGVTVNEEDLTARAELFSTAVPLAIGDNSVSVVARDGAGNVTTRTIAIVLDATAPAMALAEPADNSVTGVPHFTASGTVAPGNGVTLVVNGGPPQSLTVSGGGFTGSGYLEPGVNTITVTATLSGRSSMVKRSLTYAPGNAAVAITDPAEDIRTERKAMTIRGTAGSSGGANVLLNVDGTLFTLPLRDGAFQQEISLEQPGQHQVSAAVTDSDGNLSVAHRNIIRIDRIMGDLNFDGLVDIEDAAALLRIALDMEPATAQALSHGDLAPLVNGVSQPDGRIDVGDVLVLLRKIVGLVD